MEKCVSFNFIFFILWETFNGLLRYWFYKAGIIYAVYISKLLVGVCIFLYIVHSIRLNRVNTIFLIVNTLLVFSTLIAYFYVSHKVQILFGWWTIIPFIFGIISSKYLNLFRIRKYLLMIFLLSILGVIISALFSVPWVGLSYSIGNISVEGSREWYSFGVLRTPGFGRISATTSAIILVLSLILIYVMKNRFIKVFIWLIAGIGILFTLTKTTIGIWLLFSLVFAISSLFRTSVNLYVKLIAFLSFLVGFLLPWYSYYRSLESAFLYSPLFWSFRDRLESMWPGTIEILLSYGNLIFGRGLGGLGASQFYFERNIYTPTDNLMLYVYGLFGVWGILSMFLFLIYLLTKKIKDQEEELFLILATVVLIWGITINSLENPIFSLIFGLSVSSLFRKKYHLSLM